MFNQLEERLIELEIRVKSLETWRDKEHGIPTEPGGSVESSSWVPFNERQPKDGAFWVRSPSMGTVIALVLGDYVYTPDQSMGSRWVSMEVIPIPPTPQEVRAYQPMSLWWCLNKAVHGGCTWKKGSDLVEAEKILEETRNPPAEPNDTVAKVLAALREEAGLMQKPGSYEESYLSVACNRMLAAAERAAGVKDDTR